MSVAVIAPPAPIVTPAEIAGSHAPDDPMIAALIQAATEEIDGPTGWVGRCFGPQTLELRLDDFPREWLGAAVILPCPPLIEMISAAYRDPNGVSQTVPASELVETLDAVSPKGGSWPETNSSAGNVRIRYRAGYDGETTPPLPERARQAVILGVRALLGLGAEQMVRSETVEGVGALTFVGADVASQALRQTSERLLAGLRRYS